MLSVSLANKPRCGCRRKSREKGDRENNARPKPFRLPVLALCRCLFIRELLVPLHVCIISQETNKKKGERRHYLFSFALSFFFFSLHSIRSFHFFFSSRKKKKNGNPVYFLIFLFQMIVCHYCRCFSLIFQFTFKEEKKKEKKPTNKHKVITTNINWKAFVREHLYILKYKMSTSVARACNL